MVNRGSTGRGVDRRHLADVAWPRLLHLVLCLSEFSVNPHRLDPYKNHRFRVKWDGRYVAGISRVSPLRRTTAVITHRSGADANLLRRSPGVTDFAPVVLERGVTHDAEFEQWANLAFDLGGEIALRDFRKDVVLDFFNEAGQLALSYRIHRCWVSEYVALPELDASAPAVAIQRLTLENEGWERDAAVAEPQESSGRES